MVKDIQAQKPLFRRTTFAIVLVMFLVLFSRLFWLQIVQDKYYRDLATQNRIRLVKKRAPRGLIRDRNGKTIAGNRPAYSISALPFEFKPKPELMSRLSELTGKSVEELIENYEKGKKRNSQYTPIRLASDVSMADIVFLEEHSEDFPGITKEIEPIRHYPDSSIAPHLLGYTGQISIEELRSGDFPMVNSGDLVGKSGVERQYDQFLRGDDGVHYIEVRVNGEVVGPAREFDDIAARSGADIYLSLDKNLQYVAESLMASFPIIEKGCFIALDPRNGDILAMVSKPDFDLSIFTKPIKDSSWAFLNNLDNNSLLNRSIQGTYPPASGLKLLGAMIGLDKGYITAETKMPEPCRGWFYYGDRYYNCWLHTGHGNVDLMDAIAQSCDVYFYQLGLQVGIDDWSYYTKLSGFGSELNIDLPSEAKGFVPDREFFTERYGRYGWGYGVILNLIIGQGETLVTPLQLLSFIGAISQGGAIYRPRVAKMIDPSLGRAQNIKKHSLGKLPFTENAISTAVDACIRTVNDPMGTGAGAYMEDVVVAGKTGTAQNPHGASHALFTSFAPADDPKIALLILVEHGGGGSNYAFIHRMFYDYYFNYWERGFARY
ncbi:MAG: penicillin-binding protein 2 [Candidatus Zixiibacteriota bacterium]